MPEITGEQLQAEVIAWLGADPSRGYKRAAKQFGLPVSTVAAWGRAAREGLPLPKPDTRSTERAERHAQHVELNGPVPHPSRARANPLPEAEPVLDWDPAECTREEFLQHSIREALVKLKTETGGVARQWAQNLADRREELDQLRAQLRAEREAAGRAKDPEPADLARRLIKAQKRLVMVLPRPEAIRMCRALCAALGGAFVEGEAAAALVPAEEDGDGSEKGD